MDSRKTSSTFYPPALMQRARENARKYPELGAMRDELVSAAAPWLRYSDDELRGMMFSPVIPRAWMVYSNGTCPICQKSVPMYTWKIDTHSHPWKVQCPHCNELFPQNDFRAFYESGLDENGAFDFARADRSLLGTGTVIDDGMGYVEGAQRWRLIGAYLIYGQWKQLVLGGVRDLAAAYVVTEDVTYSHKCAILLREIAKVYPQFDFAKQGTLYEQPGLAGYVSTWHDACEETRQLAIAYDQIFETLDEESREIIEAGILRDALAHPDKIRSNFPRTEVAIAMIRTILDWPGCREEVYSAIDAIVEKSTAVDGLTGEKGLTSYACFTIAGLATLLGMYRQVDSSFLATMLKRNPKLAETYRFHIDTHCIGRFYPQVGDSGVFAERIEKYCGVPFYRPGELASSAGNLSGTDLLMRAGMQPSNFALFYELFKVTGDVGYARVLLEMNGGKVEGIPFDLFAEDPARIQRDIKTCHPERYSAKDLAPSSRPDSSRNTAQNDSGRTHKPEWKLAILREGAGENARALWMHYDTDFRLGHAHRDAFNIGLFGHGIDLMPDLGYPPVQYGGWETEKVRWYRSTAAHNTIVLNDADHEHVAETEFAFLESSQYMQGMRSRCKPFGEFTRYQRMVAMIGIDERDFYIVDLFHVAGGTSHTKYFHSNLGAISAEYLNQGVTWNLADGLRLHYTDLTEGASASTCQGWISTGGFNETKEDWLNRLMVRREGVAPLYSTFVAIIEPYKQSRRIQVIARQGNRISIVLNSGEEDTITFTDDTIHHERR